MIYGDENHDTLRRRAAWSRVREARISVGVTWAVIALVLAMLGLLIVNGIDPVADVFIFAGGSGAIAVVWFGAAIHAGVNVEYPSVAPPPPKWAQDRDEEL